jgi:hypothetical protein
MDKIISLTLPTIVLLSIVWSILFISLIFIRYQLKKEEQSNLNNDSQLSYKEIDDLAIYVSNLPRTKEIINEYRIDEKD